MSELIDIDYYDQIKGDFPDCNLDQSHNKHNCVCSETKLIIVGTITPPGNQYFYCSKRNRIYGYIDDAKFTCLKLFKNEIYDSKRDKQDIVFDIIKELKKNNIAFLDVMKYVIRKDAASPYDNDILYYCLDFDTFDNIPQKAMIICNSKLAFDGYLKIEKQKALVNKKIILSQRFAKKSEWVRAIQDATK